MNLTRFKKYFSPILLILIIPLILVGIWFHEGFILGTAESMIPFYNLESFQNKTEYAWTDFHLGSPSTLTLASFPTWWFLAQMQKIGVPGFFIQASMFWLIFIISGLGIYKLTQTLFPQLDKRYLVLGTLFYWFNPLSLVNVWNRFLYNYMVFYAVLPFILLLYTKGLEKRKYIFAIILPLFLAFFSFAFTAYVFNLLVFLLLAFTCLFLILVQFKKDFIFFCIKFNLIILVGFLLVDAWWILPTFQFVQATDTSSALAFFLTPEGNLSTLNTLSNLLGNLIDITRFIHIAFYQNLGPSWAHVYIALPLNIIFLFVSSLFFWGIYISRKLKWGLFLGTLSLVGIFFAKGNMQPFGEIFQSLFIKLPVIQIFRDPFEKFSFILSLVAAPLFVFGFQGVKKKISKELQFLPILMIAIIMIILAFPFFSGWVFTSVTPPNDNYAIGFKVLVPSYYKDADSWLKTRGNNFRFIGFPLGDEGMTYTWEKGYQGVEPSEILFSTPGITFNTTIPYYSQIVQNLEELLFDEPDFNKIAHLLNVRYFLVHSDVDIRERKLRDPQVIEDLLIGQEKKGLVKKVASFDKLTLWENQNWTDTTVYATTNLIYTFPQPKISNILFQNTPANNSFPVVSSNIKTEDRASLMMVYPEEIKSSVPQNDAQYFEEIKKYQVNIDKQSDFELILKNIYLSDKEATIAALLKINIDGSPLNQEGKLINNNKISYGQINLGVGTHEISIARPISINLIVGGEKISLAGNKGQNTASFEITEFDPYSRYLVEFDYLVKSGKQFLFMFQHSNDILRNGSIVPQYPYYNILSQNNFNGFNHARGFFAPQRSGKAGLLFYADLNSNTEVEVRNISAKRLVEPLPVLINKNSLNLATSPSVTYTKYNPAKYLVHIEGSSSPFALVLSELFNTGWEATFDDHTVAQDHFLANAYANGWLIDKTGSFNITLEFTPQKLLDSGKIISGVSFLLGLTALAYIFLRKRYNKT